MKTTLSRLAVALLAVAVLTGAWFAYNANRAMRNSYAIWWAADMVTEHLRANDNEWPRTWDDLRDDYEICVSRSGASWTLDEIRHRVTIDFSVDTDSLIESSREQAKPNFSVINLSDGTNSHWQDREPNTIILDYLHDRSRPLPIHTGFGGNAL